MTRQSTLDLKLGPSQVDLLRLVATERMSEHFKISIEVLSSLHDFELEQNLGREAKIEAKQRDRHLRYFHGIVQSGEHVGEIPGTGQVYRLFLVPTAKFHDAGQNFRIFQNKTVREIVEFILGKCHIAYKFSASGGQRKRAYCVQYGESDFSFVSRLLEEHGLYYFYDHSNDGHTLTICDKANNHKFGKSATLHYNEMAEELLDGDLLLEEGSAYVHGLQEAASTMPIDKVTLRDFDFKEPAHARMATKQAQQKHLNDSIEMFEWPGRYYKESEGQDLATYRLESIRAQRVTYRGSGLIAGFCAGNKIKIQGHERAPRLNDEYLVIETQTRIAHEAYRSEMGSSDSRIDFVAIKSDVQFRAPMNTPRPRALGPETAIVTGPANEEIHVDEWGRVKVHFHWDRSGISDDNSSCWLRVSQTGGLGNIIHPRVGQEVLVDFINGDPDRPIVVGRVYNEGNKPTYDLPANKTRAVWRSKTYKRTTGETYGDSKTLGMSAPAANEVRMEDATGKEEFFIHAEKDMNFYVRHFSTYKVGGNEAVAIGMNRTEEVGQDEKITIGANRTETVNGDEQITVNGKRTESVGGDENITIGAKQTITVGSDITITSGSKITLICGASMIEIGPGGIKLNAPKVHAFGMSEAKMMAAQVDVTGGQVGITGGLVKIN